MGAGAGRHAFEAFRRGARVVALDYGFDELTDGRRACSGPCTRPARPAAATRLGAAVNGDGTRLPFPDDTFDRIICSEVLEHIPDDDAALAELHRVLKPGGMLAATVPTWFPEKVCWALSDEYHAPFVAGRPRAHLHRAALRRTLRDGRLPARRHPPRPRPALALLVAEVRGRPDQRRPPAGARRTTGSWCGTSPRPRSSPAGPRRS